MSLADNHTPEALAKEIERNLNLDPANYRIWFEDYDWSLIVRALRFYAEHQGK